jgi:hypothetical protein
MRYLPTGPPRVISSQRVNKQHRFMLFALLEAERRVLKRISLASSQSTEKV